MKEPRFLNDHRAGRLRRSTTFGCDETRDKYVLVKPLIIQYLPVFELQLPYYNVVSTISLALCICLCEKSIQPVIQMFFICTSISSFELKTP